MFFAVPSTLSQSSPSVRNATHLRTFCFFRINFSLSRDLFQPACSFGAQFSLRQPLTSVTNAKNLWTFCFKGHHNESLCLSLFLYFIQVYYPLSSQKAKSRGGTLVTRAYVSVGNDDVSIVCTRKYEMVKMT